MENQSAARLGEESLNETPRPQANSTAMMDSLVTARASLLNAGLPRTTGSDCNSMNQFSPDFDERSSLSSIRSKSLNRSEFSKSSLGIVNVDQVSDYYTGFLTDFDKDDDSVSSFGRKSRKSDIENHLRQCFERDSLGQTSKKGGEPKEKTTLRKLGSVSSLDTSTSSFSNNNVKNPLKSGSNNKIPNDQVLDGMSGYGDVSEIENYFKAACKTSDELDAIFKTSDEENKTMEAYFNDLKDCQNVRPDVDCYLSKSPNFDLLVTSPVKKSNNADSILGSQMDKASLQSFGFSSGDFQSLDTNSFMQELELDEKRAKKINTTVSDQAIDESLSGIMSGDISIGPDSRMSMGDYLMQKCHSVSELTRKPLEAVKELDEYQPFQEDARMSISEGIPSDESTYNWSRIMRGSLCKSSFGVDLNASTSSIVSLSEIAKIIQEQPSSATPRTIIDALYAKGHAKHSKFDKESLGQSFISSSSGIASNHSPPERDTASSRPLRSVSAFSLLTDEVCSSHGSYNQTSINTSKDRTAIDRTSLNSCKSLPNPNPVSRYNEFRRTSSAPPMKSTRLSMNDKFLSAHSTPNECKFIPLQAPLANSECNLSKDKSQHWSNNSLQNKNFQTPTESSVKGSEFELALTDPSTDDKYESAYGGPKVPFCMTESGLSNGISNSDNECVQSPSSSKSSKWKNFGSDHSKTITDTSRNESTLTPGRINPNLSQSSSTSQMLTSQNDKEQVFFRAQAHHTFASSSISLADLGNNMIDSIEMKFNGEYQPIGPLIRHQPGGVQTSSASTDDLRDQELPIIKPDVDSALCRFWLSDSESLDREEHNNSLSTINYTTDTISDCNDNETSQLSSLSSSMLTEVLSNSSILCELDQETSRIKLNLDGEGTANANEHIDAGIHCIGTPVDVVVPVLNKSKYDIIWQISYKVAPVDHTQSSVNLAHISIPHKTFKVTSNRKSNVHLIIIPVIATAIDVTLKIESLFKLKSGIRSTERSSISQIIRVIGEDPQLSVGSTSGVIYFGKMPNGCVKSENILLQNTGHSRLPVKFSIKEDGKSEVYQGHTIIEAGEKWSNTINLFAILSENRSAKNPEYEFILADLKIRLNVDPNIINESQSLCIIQLKAHILPVHLLHSSRSSPLVLRKQEASHISSDTLDVKNGSKIPLNISASVDVNDENLKSCFDVRPLTVSILQDQIVRFVVSFNTKKCTFQKIKANIHLQVEPKGIIFKAPFEVVLAPITNGECVEKISSPKHKNSGSNPASCPPSPTSSIASAFGQMQLACDAVCLMWLSVPIHTRKVQSCLIKNCGAHREKLLFQISDNNNCFKFIKSERDSSFTKEIKMSLQPSESKKLAVALFPSTPQTQAFGRITITRFGQDHNFSIDSSGMAYKRVLPLYGFCGMSFVKINGLNRDVEDRLWIYPDPETFESMFITENCGDSAAFMIIVPEQFSVDYVKPNEYILAPNESTSVNFAVNLSANRIEKLLEKQKDKDIVQVSKLTLYYGNESTRKRIKRILQKCKKKGVNLSPELEQKLTILASISSKCDISVDQLFDPIENVNLLLDEIQVVQVGVLMERSALESALLDTSPVFNDLNATVREVSILNPASCLEIVPQTLSLSASGKPQYVNVYNNSSSREITFHAVFPPEISVNPEKVKMQPSELNQLSVSYVGPKFQGNRCEEKLIRIIFDKCEIKITVDIRSEENEDYWSSLIFSSDYNIVFPQTVIGHKSAVTIKINNTSQDDVLIYLSHCDDSFYVPSESIHLKRKWYCNIRILFRPQTSGIRQGQARFSVLYRGMPVSTLTYELSAEAVNPK